MKLSTIPTQEIRGQGLSRVGAREAARAGRLWLVTSARGQRMLVIGDDVADVPELIIGGPGRVERVQCSTMSEDDIARVRLKRAGILTVQVIAPMLGIAIRTDA